MQRLIRPLERMWWVHEGRAHIRRLQRERKGLW